jgi:hypothetical protein
MNCPHCDADWDAGDVYEVLFKQTKDPEDCYVGYEPEQIELIAKHYGWTKENPVRFQRLITVKRNRGSNCWQCPDCKHYFDKDPTIEVKMTEIYLLFSLHDFAPIAAYSDKEMAEEAVYRFNKKNVDYKTLPFYMKG